MHIAGVCMLLALVLGATASAGIQKDLRAFTRSRHAYDALPAVARRAAAETTNSRRVATAMDLKRRPYYVYVTLTRDASVCTLLVQSNAYTSDCTPAHLLFKPGLRTTAVFKGLLGGVAANNITRIVLQGGSTRKTIPLTKDNGFIYGCPAPGTCAAWVKTVLGYNKAGKLVSRQTVA